MLVNWNIDEVVMKKRHPKKYKIWRIVQGLKFGGIKISDTLFKF